MFLCVSLVLLSLVMLFYLSAVAIKQCTSNGCTEITCTTSLRSNNCPKLWCPVPMWLRFWRSIYFCLRWSARQPRISKWWLDVKMFSTSLRHRSEREALIGDLAGQWQSHMYPSEDAKRPLAHGTSNNKISNQTSETNRLRSLIHTATTAECSHSAIVTFLDENWWLHRVYIH